MKKTLTIGCQSPELDNLILRKLPCRKLHQIFDSNITEKKNIVNIAKKITSCYITPLLSLHIKDITITLRNLYIHIKPEQTQGVFNKQNS